MIIRRKYKNKQQGMLISALLCIGMLLPTILTGQDVYEDDDTTQSASVAVVNWVNPPQHNFHDYGDKDWAYFFAIAPYPYTIQTKDLATSCNTAIYFYKDGLSSPPLIRNDWGPGDTETILWQCLTSGTVYLRVENYNPSVFDEGTSYILQITSEIGANNGIATALSHTAIQIVWNPDRIPPNTMGFNVFGREAFSAENFSQLNSSLITVPVFDYIDEGLSSYTAYLYYVEAVDSSYQTSQYVSNLYEVTLQPGAKVGPTVLPEPLDTAGLSNTIYWTSVPEASQYQLQYSDNYVFYQPLGSSDWISPTEYTVFSLEDGERYYYRVKWRDASLDQSVWSNVVYSVQQEVSEVADWNLY